MNKKTQILSEPPGSLLYEQMNDEMRLKCVQPDDSQGDVSQKPVSTEHPH